MQDRLDAQPPTDGGISRDAKFFAMLALIGIGAIGSLAFALLKLVDFVVLTLM